MATSVPSLHQALLRALVAAQVAVFEHVDADVNDTEAFEGLETCLKEATKIAKQIRAEYER